LKGGRLTTSVLDTDSESIWCRTHLCALYFWYVLNFVTTIYVNCARSHTLLNYFFRSTSVLSEMCKTSCTTDLLLQKHKCTFCKMCNTKISTYQKYVGHKCKACEGYICEMCTTSVV
jgi:hypothetical protein